MRSKHVILADADSFYASCERVFNPALAHSPIVVLSNNDGCIVARNAEAKTLGIPGYAPWFTVREKAMQQGVKSFSSNYELYGSLSSRMMRIMSNFLPHQEIYSIDEAFFTAYDTADHLTQQCLTMQKAVWTGIHIPISVSIGPTYTLAKTVNHWAKKNKGLQSVTSWDDVIAQDPHFLESIHVQDVWGIGRRLSTKLVGMGICTAAQLRDSDIAQMRHRFSVLVEQTILELRGTPCITIRSTDPSSSTRDNCLMYSRMFGCTVSNKDTLHHIINVYTQKAAYRLARQHSLCGRISVFCATGRYEPQDSKSYAFGTYTLPTATNNPLTLLKHAYTCIENELQEGVPYKRAGVLLHDLVNENDYVSLDFGDADMRDDKLTLALENVHHKFGYAAVGIGHGGIRPTRREDSDTHAQWNMKRAHLSARATTCWDEMAIVHAK